MPDLKKTLQIELTEGFNKTELDQLCFVLKEQVDKELDIENFPTAKNAFIIALIDYFYRRNIVQKLVEKARELRPDRNWPEFPESQADRIFSLKGAIDSHISDIDKKSFTEIGEFLNQLEEQSISEPDEKVIQDMEKCLEGKFDNQGLNNIWSKKQSAQQESFPIWNI